LNQGNSLGLHVCDVEAAFVVVRGEDELLVDGNKPAHVRTSGRFPVESQTVRILDYKVEIPTVYRYKLGFSML